MTSNPEIDEKKRRLAIAKAIPAIAETAASRAGATDVDFYEDIYPHYLERRADDPKMGVHISDSQAPKKQGGFLPTMPFSFGRVAFPRKMLDRCLEYYPELLSEFGSASYDEATYRKVYALIMASCTPKDPALLE